MTKKNSTATKTISSKGIFTATLYVAFNAEGMNYSDVELALKQSDMRAQVEDYIREHSHMNIYGLKLNAQPDTDVDADTAKGAAFKRVHDAHSKRVTRVTPEDIAVSDGFGRFASELGASTRVKRAAQDGASADRYQKLAYLIGAGLSEADAMAVLDMMK